MANILEQLAGNKAIAQLAFKSIKKHIKSEGITLITLYIDNNGDISAKEYKEPVVVLKQEDYYKIINKTNEPAQ